MVSISINHRSHAYTISLPVRAASTFDISHKLAELYLQLSDVGVRSIAAAGVELEAGQAKSAIELMMMASEPGSLVEYLCYDNQYGKAAVPNFNIVYERGAAVVVKRRLGET